MTWASSLAFCRGLVVPQPDDGDPMTMTYTTAERLDALAHYIDHGVTKVDAHLVGTVVMDEQDLDSLMLAMRRAASMVIDIAATVSPVPRDRAEQLGLRVLEGGVGHD